LDFSFELAGLTFFANQYDWMVINGPKAIYMGNGTVNGEGNYGFLIAVIDAKLSSASEDDLFRIKIWDKATGEVIYDLQPGDGYNAAPITPLNGGSIVIH